MHILIRIRWGIVLGFALGGFFDGILLHQILQWHHLLSLVPSVSSLRLQVLWDGYFHAAMYLVALVGLWGLWRNRACVEDAGGSQLMGALLIGFGLWHIVDSVLSHWVLGIHRIRLDSPNPLLWDLVWFTVFGVLPLVAGLLLRGKPLSGRRANGGTLPIVALGLATGAAAIWSAQPPEDQRFTTVVFSPLISPAQAIDAVRAEGAKLVWSDPAVSVLVVAVPEERRFEFYRHGALLVSGAGPAGGCFNWSV